MHSYEADEIARSIIEQEVELDRQTDGGWIHATVFWRGHEYVGALRPIEFRKYNYPGLFALKIAEEPMDDKVFVYLETINPTRMMLYAVDELDMCCNYHAVRLKGSAIYPISGEDRLLLAAFAVPPGEA